MILLKSFGAPWLGINVYPLRLLACLSASRFFHVSEIFNALLLHEFQCSLFLITAMLVIVSFSFYCIVYPVIFSNFLIRNK